MRLEHPAIQGYIARTPVLSSVLNKVLGMFGMVVLWRGMLAYILVSLACDFPISKVAFLVNVEVM